MLYFIFLLLQYGNSQWGWYECRRMLQSTIVDVSPLNFVNQLFSPTTKNETDLNIKGAYQEITKYSLSAFSLTQLLIDFRHLYKYYDSDNVEQLNYTSTDWGINITLNQTQVSLPAIFDQTNVEMVSSFKFIIFAFYTLELEIRINIYTKELYSQKYQFMNTTKVYNTQPSTAIANTSSIFVFCILETDQIQLPANILPLDEGNYQNQIISYTSDNYFQQSSYKTYSPASKYWGQRSSVAIPYIPFFSNCQGFGQYVYFYQLIEHDNCTLYKVNETEAINPFSFGMIPKSDECIDLQLYCIMDEKYNDNPRQSRWFELNTQNTMFQIQADPMSPENFGDELNELVPIKTTNSIPNGMMPLEVNLQVQYYQVTSQDKRIITGAVTFTNFYKLSDDQKAGKSEIVYNLIFNFISMTQGQLVNNFALEWPVYFILYSIIGAILTLEVATFFLYHYIANRRRPRPKVKFVAYLKSKFQYDGFAGSVLAFFPGMTVYVLISVIMSGQIWNTDLSLNCNFTPQSDTDTGCAIVLFDLFKNQLKYTDSEFTNLRNARCGISFITVGIYMAYYISGIYIPDNKKENIEYNGNVMNVRLWKRSRILYCLLFITTLILLLTEFSFSNLFQNNAYVFLILLKVMQMMLETILEFYFDNNLISSPIGIILSTYINVATMGNPTFYAFLLSTFVDKGIEMCERAYIIKIQDVVIESLEEQYEKVFKLIKRLLDEEEENFELEDEKLIETQKVLKTNEDDSDSDIVFSDDGKENLASDDESVISNKISSNHQENSFTKDEQDEFESKFRTHLLDQHHKQFQQFNEEQGTLQELPDDESDQTDLIDYFTNFANDIMTIVFYPFIIIAFWMFYNQSNLLSNYQISQSQFIYYFLWAIMLIPFQVLIDIFGYNLVEQYHELDFLTYIKNTKERFRNRTLFWKASEMQNDLKCETCFKSLDQWCYSSQYYFITTLQTCAIQMIIFGSQIIYDNQYNLFEDEALIFIILFWFVVSVVLHRIFVELGKRLKIWDISSRVTPQEDQVMSSIDDEDKISNSQQGIGPSLLIPNWNQAIEFREQTERLSEINNNFDEFQNDQFRRLFVASNKQWLQDNIKILLSPKTLKTKRRQILDKFQQINGPLEKKNEEDPVAGFDNAWNFRQFSKNTQGVEIVRNQPQKFSRRLEITPASEAIVKYWLYRSRNMKTAIKYIGGLLEKITKPFCEYCGLNWGLGVDTEARIEDIYLKFLKHKGLKCITLTMGKEIDDWQNYFPKKCRFRTTCFICNGIVILIQCLWLRKCKRISCLKEKEQIYIFEGSKTSPYYAVGHRDVWKKRKEKQIFDLIIKMISYPICEQHKDCPYQYLVLKKNYQNIRLACSNCIYEDFNNKDYLPLNILQNDPNQMILNASIDDDDLMHYYKNFIQICQTDLSEIKAWKSQLELVKQIVETFIDDIDNQIIEIFNYQNKLKTIQQEFLVNFRLEEFYTLLNKMCEEQKMNASQDYSTQLKHLLDSLLGYDNRFIKENIRQLRNKHSQLRICLQETKSVKLLHEINTIVKKYSDSLSVVYSKFNSPCKTENKPSSKIVSADYFSILIQEIEKKSQKKVRFENELFKGNDFTSQTFWQYVEGKSNILLIVKSKNSIFGGFTPCEWSGQGAKADEQLTSFLFSFNNKKMYHLKRESKDSAIICDKRFGPIFGSFYFDLMIKNGQNGSSYLGHCYGDDGYKGLPSQVLFGGQHLNIVEFEIFEIVY